MNCSIFAEKGLDTLDYSRDTLAELGLSDKLFLALKQGKAAFPLGKSSDAQELDANTRAWMLGLCQLKTQTPVSNPSEFPKLFNGSKTVQQMSDMRRTIASYKDQIRSDYMRLLGSVTKAASHIPNPMLSTMMGKTENQYYKKTHDMMFDLNKAVLSNCDSALQRIDKFLTNKQSANMRTARAAGNAAAAARHRQELNTMAAAVGMPAGSKSENILAARLAALRRGGKRTGKAKRKSTNRRQTKRRRV